MQPTYMESSWSTPGVVDGLERGLVDRGRGGSFSHSSPHLVIPTPMMATSLMRRLLTRALRILPRNLA